MTLWERIKTVLKREAADVKEGMSHVGRTLDEELARKERELNATPSERFDMILEDIDESDARIKDIEATLTDQPDHVAHVRPEPTHQLLEESEVSTSLRLGELLETVHVSFVSLADGGASGPTHIVDLDADTFGAATARRAKAAAGVAEHPLVSAAGVDDAGRIWVDAPALHVQDVRLLVAAALADQAPPN